MVKENTALKNIDLEKGAQTDISDTPLVLALGNFDGVHLGHKTLITKAAEVAKTMSATAGIFCFEKPPCDFLSPEPPKRICTLDQKLILARKCGAMTAVLGDFPALRDLSPKEFTDLLKNEVNCTTVVCGYNFRFGRNGNGTYEDLKEAFGDRAILIDRVTCGGEEISSTKIRGLLLEGNVEMANRLLGHPYSVTGKVVRGKQLGRTLGLPTVNQFFSEELLIPKNGIYASSCKIDGITYRAVSNVGLRPTVENSDRINCETHIIGYSGDLYGRDLRVEFFARLRGERKFASVEELQAAINGDVANSNEYFDRLRVGF
ncbi:MAG: bifunctional riboflavin kinase/FAD synthetase [Clostridia bacterium]|nr:bifunctional riboflavin kinase/FAD synthetase [Clostridia bacterium]